MISSHLTTEDLPRVGWFRHRRTDAGFTLLEIMLALVILIILTVVVYDFTDVTLGSAKASETLAEHDSAYNGMRRLFETQLGSMAAGESGGFLGINIRGKGERRDMLQLVVPAGNGVLTPDAKGFYQITLGVRETPRGSGKYSLGMQREPWTSDDDDEDDDDDENANAKAASKANSPNAPKKNNLPTDWIPLMPGVTGLEIAYYDARLNGYVDKWTDQGALPNLVRLRLTAPGNTDPYEIIARVPNGGPRNNSANAFTGANGINNVNGINGANGANGTGGVNGGNGVINSPTSPVSRQPYR